MTEDKKMIENHTAKHFYEMACSSLAPDEFEKFIDVLGVVCTRRSLKNPSEKDLK